MMRMVIAAINVADSGVRKVKPWNDLTELEQESHPLVAMIAFGIVRILDEHGGPTLIGDLWSFQIVSIDIGAKNLRNERNPETSPVNGLKRLLISEISKMIPNTDLPRAEPRRLTTLPMVSTATTE
jgi:hypothetical protein